ncbi:MAG: pyridoxal-phosphate dependent enzyme [Candidatus Eisenbacteria bacterium]|nr:pyridoxal-phosphate dependent enzyme [Candidatus Eisenbacteria bacterium]
MDIVLPPRLSLAMLPTPVAPLQRLSDRLGGPLISVKRDDLTGCDLSGNKVRKLEYLLAEAREQRATVVLTCGGVQSNHARATAVAARRLGIDSHLILRGDEPPVADGNLLLDRMVGASVEFITPAEWKDRSSILQRAADRLASDGARPYIIPEGGSNGLGSWGYISMLTELLDENGRIPYSRIVCATGSGGTLAGLLLGRHILELDIDVTAVNVCDSAAYFRGRVREIVDDFNGRHETDIAIKDNEYEILGGFKGPGYAIPFDEEIAVIKDVARTEGLFLDPVYTGKAFLGMVEGVRRGRFDSKDHLLFLHSGGIFGLIAQREAFQ